MLRLLSAGVPWHEAWAMSPARRLAFIVADGERRGGRYDWDKTTWAEPPAA